MRAAKAGLLLAALLSGVSALSSGSVPARADPPPDSRLVVLDDDGFGLAQWMAIRAPGVTVLGMGAVSGDVWRNEAVAHALRGMELAGRPDIPVLPGAVFPLVNSEALTDRWEATYGKLVWKGAWMKRWVEPTVQSPPHYHAPDVVPDLPEGNPTIKARTELAANFLIRMVHEHPGQVSIIATGPLTDLALAQRLDPDFAGLARELVYMGGSLNPHQTRNDISAAQFAREYVNAPRREFNIRFDPEAASIVMRAPWRHMVMVPADPATATELTPDLIRRLSPGNGPIAHAIRAKEPGFPLWDEIAVGVWLDPGLIRKQDSLYIDTDSQFGPGYGDIQSWTPGYQPGLGEQKETVVESIDVSGFERLMVSLLAEPVAQPAAVK